MIILWIHFCCIYIKKLKLTDIDLSREKNTSIPQEISFTGKLDEDYGAIIFLITEKRQKSILKSCLN